MFFEQTCFANHINQAEGCHWSRVADDQLFQFLSVNRWRQHERVEVKKQKRGGQ
jgi:hypothetical protein